METFSKKINPLWAVGIVSAAVFSLLLTVRLGVFQRVEAGQGEGGSAKTVSLDDQEQWMSIFQGERRIGYAHRQFSRVGEGYRISEEVLINMNSMGMTQEIRFRTLGDLAPDLTISAFNFELRSSLFRFKAWGFRQEDRLTVYAGTPGSERKLSLPLDQGAHLPASLLESLRDETLKPGDRRTVSVFDPMAMSQRSVTLRVDGEETVSLAGKQERAKKVSVDFMGTPQYAWIGRGGRILKEEGSLGMRLEWVPKEVALDKMTLSGSADVTEIASIPSNRTIEIPSQVPALRLKLKGVETGDLFLEGGRQSLKDGILTVRKERMPDGSKRQAGQVPEVSLRTSLEPDPFIQSDHPEIQSMSREIVSSARSDVGKARKLVAWVHQHLQKKPVFSVSNALETLRHRVGDCNEHAVLLAALARAAGIPAEVEAGMVYQKGRFYYHAWNVLYLGTWVTADAAMGQFPADATHVRLARGTDRQIDLIRFIGKVRLEVLEDSP